MSSSALPVTTTSLYPIHKLNGVVLLALLMATLLLGLGSSIHSRVLWLGEQLWQNYYLLDPYATKPECSLNVDIDAAVAAQLKDGKDDGFDLFESEPDPAEIRASIVRNLELCRDQNVIFAKLQSQITPSLVAFKTVERAVADTLLNNLDLKTFLFMAIFALAAAISALDNEHISLRLPQNRAEWRLAQLSQVIVNGLMVYSLYSFNLSLRSAPDTDSMQSLQIGWMLVFSLLILINLVRLVKVPAHLSGGGLNLSSGFAVPLYVSMGAIAFAYYQFVAGYSEGLANYFGQMSALSSMFINIGLYVLIGMAIKQTRLSELLLNVVKPWDLPAGPLAGAVIFITAFPTAFTGASGIFILAAGGVIYDELRKAGARRQLALATTAMSGSLGVVLNPCLLIVVVAALNKEVTTDQMYGAGMWVYLFSASLFATIVCWSEKEWKPRVLNKQKALRESLVALRALVPYALVFILSILAFQILLDLKFNEYSAPLILPLVMFAIVYLDAKDVKQGRMRAFWARSAAAASDSAVHTGALLSLIGLSICLGGVLDRSHFIEALFPTSLISPWLVMLSVVVILTFIGMIMDPFGAVILVSATIAQVAIAKGIDPLHFWIVTLVAFELGYLTPPVALNHLLTRQVVGEHEVLAGERTGSFWHRYERLLLPLAVMLPTLLLVGFVPLFFYA